MDSFGDMAKTNSGPGVLAAAFMGLGWVYMPGWWRVNVSDLVSR